jgi:hypothetical protein
MSGYYPNGASADQYEAWAGTDCSPRQEDRYTIFVFGSNLAGKHYGGAAKYAADKFYAVVGEAEGPTGTAYAIPTMDADFRQLPLEDVEDYIETFKAHAYANPQEDFYVTRVGCGIAGFKDAQIAPLFVDSPDNCTFDPQWSSYGLPAWKEVL